MFKLIFIALLFCMMNTEGVRRRFVRPVGSYSGAGSYAGSGAGGGYGGFGGGYVGGYAGTGDGGFVGTYSDDYGDYDPLGTPYAADFGLSAAFIDPYVFHQQLTAQIQAQHAATQNLIHRQIAQQAYFDNVRRRNNFSHGGYNSNRYAPSYASASGSVGPGGFYQTAVVNPPSAHTPNIVNRFSPGSSSGGPGGYHGVSVSSFSGSSDVNGKRTNVQGAQTTVNDNGKVSTYSVHS